MNAGKFMKQIKAFFAVFAATVMPSALGFGAVDLPLSITTNLELRLFGRLGNNYQWQSSTNLVNWDANVPFFTLLSVPHTQAIDGANIQGFFRARALVSATNTSYPDTCAEHDNVNVALRGDVARFSIIATHPLYQPTSYDCPANWGNCLTNEPGTNYSFPYLATNSFDDHIDVVRVHRETNFWRPQGMTVTVNGTNAHEDIHYVELYRRTDEEAKWPGFLVLYSDGNVRLIPFPPLGETNVCFGSSVIVGPASVAFRPFIDIASVDYRSPSRTLFVTYRTGGTALLDVNTVTRTTAIVEVTVDYPTDQPFCTFRSMFASEGTNDVSRVEWIDLSGISHDDPIMSFSGTVGKEWFFKRLTPSTHNNSAPDIRIKLMTE